MSEDINPREPVEDVNFVEVFEVFEDDRPDPLASEQLGGLAGRGSMGDSICHCSSMLG
jgi:hypothetical protein